MKTQNNNIIYMEESPKYSFSLDMLKEIGNNNVDFVVDMLKQFKESAVESSERMTTGIAEKDLDKVKRAAHKGVPSYSIMKLVDCVNLMKTIEIGVDSGTDFASIKENVKRFDEKNQSVLLELTDCMKHLEETKVFPA